MIKLRCNYIKLCGHNIKFRSNAAKSLLFQWEDFHPISVSIVLNEWVNFLTLSIFPLLCFHCSKLKPSTETTEFRVSPLIIFSIHHCGCLCKCVCQRLADKKEAIW